MMREVKTESGFVCEVDEQAFNDMELLEDLAALDGGDVRRVPAIVVQLLGTEGKKALYNHIRTESGRVPIDAAVEEIKRVMEALSEGKK